MVRFVPGIIILGLCALRYSPNAHAGEHPEEMYHKDIVYANATHICILDIRAFENNIYDAVCIFNVLKHPAYVDTTAPAGRRWRQDTSENSTDTPIPTTSHINATTKAVPTVSHDDRITMFDMNSEKRILYFASVDNNIYEREIDLEITNDVKVLVVRASGTISGLAYDAGDTNNLYWCESDPGVMKGVDLETKSTKNISVGNTTLTYPRNVIVLLNPRKLAWIAGTTNASIQTMTMAGEDIKVVYEHNANISSLVADEDVQLFYFLSQEKVYSLTFGGLGLKEVTAVEGTAYKLLLYNSYLAWIYTKPEYSNWMKAIRVDTSIVNGHGRYLDKVSTIVDIKVLYTKLPTANISKSICTDGSLSHGYVAAACGKQIGETCHYQCDQGYTNITHKAVCTNDLRWHPLNACIEPIVLPKPPDDESWAIIIGIFVLFIIILAAVVVSGVFLSRKKIKKASSKYKIASFRHHDDRIAIVNIQFDEIATPMIQAKNEHRYQMLFGKEGAAAVNDSLLNSACIQDPLSAAGPFEVTRDRAILTYEAWLKEREKWKQMDKL